MRLFVAVELAPAVAETVALGIDELKTRALELAPRFRATWIPIERLHLTIRFIGEVGDDAGAAVQGALAPALPVAPFDLILGGTGAFPRTGPPRVLWAGVVEGGEALRSVEREVTRRLAGVGIPPDDKAFNPHLTLARVRDAAGLRTRELFAGAGRESFGASRVDAITLFESVLSPRGPTYRVLCRTAFRREE